MKSKIRELIKALNREKNTTVILTTHDMGDVDALCSRIVIIDKGTMLYDNNIEKLRVVFGAYRTVKVMFGENQNEDFEKTALEMESYLKNEFPYVTSLSVSLDDKWIAILINEDEVAMMEIINCIQKKRKIADMLLQEISTESVIKKVYEGGL
jgi:ABC-2 type transport system ATP-binding protein